MRKIRHWSIVAMILISSGCNSKSTNENSDSNKNSPSITLVTNKSDTLKTIIMDVKLKNRYDIQSDFIYAAENELDNNYSLSEDDIIDIKDIISETLKKDGYKKPTENEFYDKIKYYFSISDQDINNDRLVKNHKNFFTFILRSGGESIDNVEYSEFNYPNNNDYFIKELYFFMPLTLLPDIIEQIDNKTMQVNLDKRIVHRNMFIFNNNQASLTWLINNDIPFLERLLLCRGFDRDNKINKAVLDKIDKTYRETKPLDISELDGLFATIDLHDKLKIHENILNYIVENTTIQEFKYYSILEDFAYGIMDAYLNKENNYTFYGNLSDPDKIKLLTFLSYYIELIWEKCDPAGNQYWASGSIMRNRIIFEKNILNIIEKENYYNISNLKHMINKNIDSAND